MDTKRSEFGASIMEVMIVMVVAAIMTTAAVSMFGRSRDIYNRQNAARQFKNMLERARFDSVKRRAATPAQMAKIIILSANSYSYTLDLNQNGIIDDPNETVTVNTSLLSDLVISGNSLVFPITISFDERGTITAVNGSSSEIMALFYFCNGTCTPSTATASNADMIYVSPSGTVAMMSGGDAVPFFTAPSVTAVNSNTTVNPLLAVWETDPNATPEPAPAASPTPTVAPSPTPTPTPTPITSPTPSPTPAACSAGQAVSSGCRCVSPMWVRSNGKCR